MIYADSDFFLAIVKESDWLKTPAERLLQEHAGEIWTSSAALIELLLLAEKLRLDPEQTLVNVLKIAHLQGGKAEVFLIAADHMKERRVHVFDALHAAFCGLDCPIISSDRVFDRLGLKRIPLEAQEAASPAGRPR